MDELKHIEVELKFPLLNYNKVIEHLDELAEIKKDGDYQKDVYYVPKHREFLEKNPISEWLRVRKTDNSANINYKKWHNEDGQNTVSCDEYETKIDDIISFKKILLSLDFKEIVVVEKKRRVWYYKNTEIAIDEVKDLGCFIEIEAKGNFSSIDDAKKHLYEVIKELKAEIGEQDFRGYPYLLLEKKKLM